MTLSCPCARVILRSNPIRACTFVQRRAVLEVALIHSRRHEAPPAEIPPGTANFAGTLHLRYTDVQSVHREAH